MISQDLLKFIDKDTLDRFIHSFALATGIAVDINDSQGYPIAAYRDYYGFCRLIRSTPQGVQRCLESNAKVGYLAAATMGPVMESCHGGLTLLGAPIFIDQAYIGSIVCGQFHARQPSPSDISAMLQKTADLGLHRQELVENFMLMEVISPEKSQAACDIIQLVAGYIAELVYKSNMQQELAKQKLKAVEEAKARVELENALRTAELRGLQAQIRPHFLFNTFNTITRLITLGDTARALDITYALSGLLRFNLEQQEEVIPLKKEMVHVNNYLLIQQTRLGKRLSVNINLSDRLLDVLLPPLTIQPLVENACIHGIEPKEGLSTLTIIGRQTQKKAVIDIIDNGIGISEKALSEFAAFRESCLSSLRLHLPGRIGLRNVHRRLQLTFGQGYGLELHRLAKGTRVRVTLPVQPKSDLKEN